jgi:CspA family cold shock protein|tara:strand:- start:747 stop:950 length:204 start_codon:yes stop_codon:yes gene_type:complete
MSHQGIVKWYNPSKGYGFIKQNGGNDIFVHSSEVEKAGIDHISDNQRIEFDIEENKGRTSAVKLKLL